MSGQDGVERAALNERLIELAEQRRPDDRVFRDFVAEYYEELPEFDVDDQPVEDRYAAALAHYLLGRRREPMENRVAVLSPDRERDGWHSERSLLMAVTDDVAFLIDTIRMVLQRHGVIPRLLVHPILSVARDRTGELVAVGGAADTTEAWTLIEIDRVADGFAEQLREEVTRTIRSVHQVVGDLTPMRERIAGLADIDPLLPWLADRHFVFLGAATFRVGQGEPELVEGSELGQPGLATADDPPIRLDGPAVQIARSSRRSAIHRDARLTMVSVRDGDVVERFVGLPSAGAYRTSVFSIPTVGDRARAVLAGDPHGEASHTVRAMRGVIETLPRDLVFELPVDDLRPLVEDVVGLQERQIVRVFDVPEPDGRMSTVLAYLPRDRYTAQLPDTVGGVIEEAYGAPISDLEVFLGESSLVRITCTVEAPADAGAVDLDALSKRIDQVSTSWADRVRQAASQRWGEAEAARFLSRFADSASTEFRSAVPASMAVDDLEHLGELMDGSGRTATALICHVEDPDDGWRMRVYRRGEPIALAELLPLLGHVGLRAIDEHPYRFRLGDEEYYLYDVGVRSPVGLERDDHCHHEVQSTLLGLLEGTVEADGFNRLVLVAGLTARQANILRCYAKYASQIGFAFSQGYIEDTLARLPDLSGLLVELFEARFDPDLEEGERLARVATAEHEILDLLDALPSLDDDRTGRMFLALIRATVRTNAYQIGKPTVAFKFNPALIPELPAPRPAHEIFVCSARVEGVHLRGGAIARGGLRWSDRPEDYRTEVLGLVKAQMVKNAVIVPVGAKGGFVVKQPKADPAEQRAEGQECYRLFVRGLLDITDNVSGREVRPPERVVRYDGDDPYLVVAADKGTAAFSDAANAISAEYDFWLGDAFASGGSAGYDHKEMGITARGAWESARRHGSLLGTDVDNEEFTAVGIGDMSGDVFGNGMLLSKHMKLIAAFDHRDIFIDPDPDPARGWNERKRLFELPRSSWQDYDQGLISPGGGVFSRSLKSIDLSPEARAALGTDRERMSPQELISAVLMAPVDMLWNGGIGTYIKASTEPNAAVGDRGNDAVRVNANQLRARMVVEGGNLGVTQLGRVEYALNGGLIYTDAIDNSAGVDSSDREVNIKILLNAVVADGELTLEQRNELLESMTDEVAELVLDDNQAQTLALMIARTQGPAMANVHSRYIDQLEADGFLDREIEFLPSDKQLAERMAAGSGLRAPEMAVMIAYTKNADTAELLRGSLPDDPVFVDDLVGYFPTPLRERFREEILDHRLRREIIATVVVNQMVNLSGISFDHRMTEDTGAALTDVVAAWVVTREVLGFDEWWAEIEAVPDMDVDDRIKVFLECRRAAERSVLWLLRHRRPPLDIRAAVEHFRNPVRHLLAEFPKVLIGRAGRDADAIRAERLAQGVPAGLAERTVSWRVAHTAFDVVELASRTGKEPVEVAAAYWQFFDRLELMWLWDGIGALPRADRWQTQARSSLRDDLLTVLAAATENIVTHGDGSVDAWIDANRTSFNRVASQLTEVKRSDNFDITRLSVGLRQLRNLVATSIRSV